MGRRKARKAKVKERAKERRSESFEMLRNAPEMEEI